MKVSILAYIYNPDEVVFRKAIESILGQTLVDFELLFLDDASDPYVKDIIFAYKDERIKYIRSEDFTSYDSLIDLAQGEYLAIMEQGSISMPQRLEKQANILDADISLGVVGSFIECGSGNIAEVYAYHEDIVGDLFVKNSMLYPSVMIRKSVLEYVEANDLSHPYKLWCGLVDKTKFANIAEVLVMCQKCEDKYFAIDNEAALKLRADYTGLWEKAQILRVSREEKIKLFDLIPLITIRQRHYVKDVYLFNTLKLMTIKKKFKMKKK